MDALYINVMSDFTIILYKTLNGQTVFILQRGVYMELAIGPPILLGLIIGIYEAIVIHRDVTLPIHRAGHTAHAILLSILFVFCSMNASYVLSLLTFLKSIPVLGTALGLQVLVGLIAAAKIHAVSKAKTATGISGGGETWFHSILIGALVIAAPYVFLLIKPILPKWLLF